MLKMKKALQKLIYIKQSFLNSPKTLDQLTMELGVKKVNL